MNKLFSFNHGLGDACQFTIVLKHLRHYHPDWNVAVETSLGLHSVFDNAFPLVQPYTWRDTYGQPQKILFQRPERIYNNMPSTKVTRCLTDEFGLEPIPDLYKYEIHPTEATQKKVARYIEEEIKGEYAVISYKQSKSSKEDKELTDYEASLICDMLLPFGVTPVILDWEPRNRLAGDGVLNPWRGHPYLWDKEYVGDGATIYELINHAVAFFGIDSGPAHIAAATNTPSYVFWWGTMPIHCFDPAENVTHIIDPTHHIVNEYFLNNYHFDVYDKDHQSENPAVDFLEKWLAEVYTEEKENP